MKKISDELRKLKTQVKYCLHKWPEARNSDKTLALKLWQEFYPEFIFTERVYGLTSIRLGDIYNLPSFDNMSRYRRQIQESGEYPPTDEKIALERGWLSDEWKKALGYFLESPGQKKFDFVS